MYSRGLAAAALVALSSLALCQQPVSPATVSAVESRGANRESGAVDHDNTGAGLAAGRSSSLKSPGQNDNLRIGSGDMLEISVYGVPELSQKVRVSNSGDVSLPLMGPLHLEGLTAEKAQSEIEYRLFAGGFLKSPHVSVLITEYATQGASVLGEVMKPGVYPVLGSRRLFDLISAAAGTTPRAGRLVTITRRSAPTTPIHVDMTSDPLQSMNSNVEINPGDTIVVSKAGLVYVVGDVNKPGGYVMENNETLTVLQALALAQGEKGTASLDRAKLIRKTAKGPQEIPIPLKKILAAKATDIQLQPEDIVFIPSSVGKSVARRSLEAIVQVSTGLAIYRR